MEFDRSGAMGQDTIAVARRYTECTGTRLVRGPYHWIAWAVLEPYVATKLSFLIRPGMLPRLLAFAVLSAGCASSSTLATDSQRSYLREAWRAAYEENSIQSYERFIREFDASNPEYSSIRYWSKRDELVSLARDKILEVETWIGAGKQIRLLDDFLEKYPESQHAAEARVLIDDLSTLSPDEMDRIVERGTIAFSTDQKPWRQKLYKSGFNVECDNADAAVQIVYEYDETRLGAKYVEQGSSKTAVGESGATGSMQFEIRIDGDPVYAAYGDKRINPEYRIGASATTESINRVGDRKASEIRSELLRPVRQVIDDLAKSRRVSLLKHLDDIDPHDIDLLKERTDFREYEITSLCRWGAFLTIADGTFRYRGEPVSVAKQTGTNLLRICDGHYRGMPGAYEVNMNEQEIDLLRTNGLVVGPYGDCAKE